MVNLLLGSTCPFNSLLCAVYCTCGVVLAKEDTQHSLIRLEQRQKSLTATSLGAVTRIFNSPPCSMRCFQPGWLYCDAKESKIALFSADVILHQIRGVTALVKNGTGMWCESPGASCSLRVLCSHWGFVEYFWHCQQVLGFCSSNNLFII